MVLLVVPQEREGALWQHLMLTSTVSIVPMIGWNCLSELCHHDDDVVTGRVLVPSPTDHRKYAPTATEVTAVAATVQSTAALDAPYRSFHCLLLHSFALPPTSDRLVDSLWALLSK